MRGRENNRTCPHCGVMNGVKWVDGPALTPAEPARL
jgi:hypothetical protein